MSSEMRYQCEECNSFDCEHQADIQKKIKEILKNNNQKYKQPEE